jgi:signal peptidase I
MSRRKTEYGILFLFLAVVASMLLTVTVSASSSDYAYFQISGKSMEPTFEEGDLVAVRTDVTASQLSAGTYPSGDIIVFHRPKTEAAAQDVLVMRRVVAIIEGGSGLLYFRTKGDGNPTDDSWPSDYRGEDYSWNGMVSEQLLMGEVISSLKDFEATTARVLGRYILQSSRFSLVRNQTVQQLRSEGYDVQGDPDWLLQVNYTRSAGYTLKGTIVAVSWPEVTVQNTEGRYDLNVTARRINVDGTLGDEVGSFSRLDQPSQLGLKYGCHDPGFGVGFNPSAFVIGNRFSIRITGPALEYVVNRTETLTNTAWGTNETYVLHGLFANASHRFTVTAWCDAESGLILRQTIQTMSLDYVTYEETETVETGVEWVIPLRETPSIEAVTLTLVVGAGATAGASALMSLGSVSRILGNLASVRVRKLLLPDRLKDLLDFYFSETLESVRQEKLEPLQKYPFISKKEVVSGIIATVASTLAFAYVAAKDEPNVLVAYTFIAVLPTTLCSIGLITVAEEFFGALTSKLYRIRSEYRVWLLGIAILLGTSYVAGPFGSPGRAAYQSGNIAKKTKGMMALSKVLMLATLLIPFSLLFMLGLTSIGGPGRVFLTLGEKGLLYLTMTTCYLLIPLPPLDGRNLFTYNKKIWLVTFATFVAIFVSWNLDLLPWAVYLGSGLGSAITLAAVLSLRRRLNTL